MAEYGDLSFDEAIRFFRQKLNLGTRRWTDIWEGMHARAFTVAGATQQALLTDFRTAIDKAISEGTTLQEFRKDFDQIVERHGWSYRGGRGWRTRVIYETNVRQAYNAGRELQMRDPALRRRRPYALYRHGDSANPRPLHLSWDGLVLPADDPWWETHTPMNGWGCSCKKFLVSERDLKRLGKTAPDTAPDDGTYMWEDTTGARQQEIPNGIDPGFAYNVGDAAWGRPLAQEAMASWKAQGASAWESLTPAGYAELGRPDRIPLDAPRARLGPRLADEDAIEAALAEQLGGEEQVFDLAGLPVLVNANSLARHVDPERSPFLPLLTETLADPYEVWLGFERHKGTGKVVMRARAVKGFELEGGKSLLVVTNAVKGLLEVWTMVPTSDRRYLNRQRRGKLLQGR